MEGWRNNQNGTVTLIYKNGNVTVKKQDFDRAFGAMINSSKEEVERDFGIR